MKSVAAHSFLFITVVLAVTVAYSLPASGSTVITRDMLQNYGLTRISDILLLVDDWALSTTDGYTWKASPNGLSTFQKQQWIVVLDGQRVDLRFFDTINLNMLPVGIEQIDSVVVISTPQLHDGDFADKGLIHFYTNGSPAAVNSARRTRPRANVDSAGRGQPRANVDSAGRGQPRANVDSAGRGQPRQGETYRAAVMGGSKTGDPGPYRYTRYNTPNVDSVGPDGSFGFGLARNNWHLRANAGVQLHFFTDVAIRPRTLDILGLSSVSAAPNGGPHGSATGLSRVFDAGSDDPWPEMRRLSASIALGYRRGNSRHEHFLGYSKAQKYFHYSEPFGREIPADNQYIHAGINGVFHTGPDMELTYRLQYSSNRLSKRENILDFDYDWDACRYVANAELTRSWPSVRGKLGAGLERMSVATGYSLTDGTGNFGRVYGSMDLSPSARTLYRMGAMATLTGGSPSAKVFWDNSFGLSERQTLETKLSFAQRHFVENDDLWYWTGRGYGILDDNETAYTVPGDIDKSNTATADITWRIRSGGGLAVGATGSYRYFSDLYLEKRDFALNVDNCVLSSPTEIITGIEGQMLGGEIKITFGLSSYLKVRAYYRYLTEIYGDDPFKEAWRTVPEHKTTVRAVCKPYDDVSFGTVLTYLSSTYWSAYERVGGAACNFEYTGVWYSPKIDGSTTLDLTARKLLLHRKIAADLICRNVWDSRRIYHPVGVSFDLSFFLQLNFIHHSP